MTTSETTLTQSEVESALTVLSTLYEVESDSDHIRTLTHACERMFAHYDGEVDTLPPVTSDVVEEAVTGLERIAPDTTGLNEEDRPLRYLLDDFIDLSTRYCNRPLPSYRNWTATYKHANTEEILAYRDYYDYEDEIPFNPVIDGTRYNKTRTDCNGSDITVHVEPDPLRNDIHVFINAVGSKKDFVNLSTHPGPNDTDPESIITNLCSEFNWGMMGDTDAILHAPPSDVLTYIDKQGWEYTSGEGVALPDNL